MYRNLKLSLLGLLSLALISLSGGVARAEAVRVCVPHTTMCWLVHWPNAKTLPPAAAGTPIPVPPKATLVPTPVVTGTSEVLVSVAVTTSVAPAEQPKIRPLSGADLMPGWANGQGQFTVSAGMEAIITTDPYSLTNSLGDTISSGMAAVILIGPGTYDLNTWVSPTGNLNAWPLAVPVGTLTDTFVQQERMKLSQNVGYEVVVVDLRAR
jgi:hypothetical protein